MSMEYFSLKLTTTDWVTHTCTPQPRWVSFLILIWFRLLSVHFCRSDAQDFSKKGINSFVIPRFLSGHCSIPSMSASFPQHFHIMPVPFLWWQVSLSSVSSFCTWKKKRSRIKIGISKEESKETREKGSFKPLAHFRIWTHILELDGVPLQLKTAFVKKRNHMVLFVLFSPPFLIDNQESGNKCFVFCGLI